MSKLKKIKEPTLKMWRTVLKKWLGAFIHPYNNNKENAYCSFCYEYRDRAGHKDCEGCPISCYTKADYCERTPYIHWCEAEEGYYERKYHALRELKFLLWLCPHDKLKPKYERAIEKELDYK